MKTLLISLVSATVFGVVMSLPFQRDTLEQLIPLARSLGATKFAHFVHEANLTANFTKKAGNFTLFVPDNKAFQGLSRNITGNKTLLRQLILFHSVKGAYNRSELIRSKKLRTLSGRFLFFNHTKTKAVLVNGVNITGFNKSASNGFIFLVNKVVLQGSGLLNKTNNKTSEQLRRQAYVLCCNGTWGRNCSHHGNSTHGNFTYNANTVKHPIQHVNGKLCINGTYGRNCTHHGNGTDGNGTHSISRICPNRTWGVNCTYRGNSTHGNGTRCPTGTWGVNCTYRGNSTHGNGTRCPNGTWGVNCTYLGNGTHGNGTRCPTGTWGVNCTYRDNGTHGNGTRCSNGTWGVNCTYRGNGTHGNDTRCPNGTWGVNCTYHGNGTHGNGTRCPNGTWGVNCTYRGNSTHDNGTRCPNGTWGVNCTYRGNGTHGNGTRCPNGTWGVNCTYHGNGTHGNDTRCPNGTWGVNCTYRGNGTHGNGTRCPTGTWGGNGTHGNGTHDNSTICLNGTWGVNCTSHGNGSHGNMTQGIIAHVLSQSYGQYSTLITDLMKTGVWSEIEGPQVTLLAPTNVAFSKLPTTYRNNLDNHAQFLKSTMMYHILDGIHGPESLHQNDMLTSLGGQRIHVSMQNGHVHQFNRVSIMNVIHATNGIIYVLDGVLHLPSSPIV